MSLIIRLAIAVALVLLSASSWAQVSYFTLIDSDNDATTGCTVAFPNSGTVAGIERRLTATVSETPPPQVIQLTLENCVGGGFGAPISLPGTPYLVGLDNGVDGADFIEQAVSVNAIAAPGTSVRFYFAARGPNSDDLLGSANDLSFLFDLRPGGAATIPFLSGGGLLVLALLLLATAYWQRSRFPAGITGVLLVGTLVGVAWAAGFRLGGQANDWQGVPAIGTDARGDSAPETDIIAAFAAQEGGNLFFRIDIANIAASPSSNQPPAFTSTPPTAVGVGSLYAYDITATDPDGHGLSFAAPALPAWLTLTDNGDGTALLSGTPASTDVGDHPVELVVTDDGTPNLSANQTFTITVGQPPAITSANSAAFTVGQAGTFTVTTTGAPPPTLAQTGTLPNGVTFTDNGDGTATLSGAPAADTGGSYTLGFTASNGIDPDATQNFTLTVDQAPAITSADSTTFTVSATGSFTVTATGFPTPTLALSGCTLPTGVTFDAASGLLSGTPAPDTGGAYNCTLAASNGVTPDATQTFTLTVTQAPALSGTPPAAAIVGGAYSHTFTVGGFPAPTLSVTAGSLPPGLSLSGNTLGGVPNTVGNFSGITVTASNDVPPPANLTFAITVGCPTITVDPATLVDGFFQQSYGPVNFTQSGSTGSTFTWGVSGLPAGLSLNSSGVLSGTPTEVGTFNVTVTVTDNFGCTGSRSATLNVRIDAVDDTYPQTVIGNVAVNSANIPFSVFSNDSAPAGATISAFDATSVRGGTVAMTTAGAGLGQFTYNPPPGYEGSDSFTYTLTSSGQSDTATVTLAVSGMIWFIDNSQASNGDGRLGSPFNSIANFNSGAADDAGDNIFLYRQTAANYTGPLTLLNNQKLIGQGATASLSVITGLTPPSGSAALPATGGTRPVIAHNANNLTLAQGNLLRGFNLSNTGGTALVGNSFGNLTSSEVSVSNTSGVAINLNTGNPTASFTSVSASGGANGISLQNTTGSFTVTGTGAADSGGTIQNTTGADNTTNGIGVYLSSAQNVSLNWMRINNHPNFAIRGTTVSGFTMDNTVIGGSNGNNAAVDEASVAFSNLTGTASISSSNISGGVEDNFRILNTTGTLAITFSSTTFGPNNSSTGNDGLLIEPSGTAVINATIQNSTFTAAAGDLFQFNNLSNAGVTSSLVFTGNTLSNNHPAIATGGGGVTIGGGDNGASLTFNISGNTFRDAVGTAVLIVKSTGGGTYSGTYANNAIGVLGVANSGSLEGSGIRIQNAGNGTVTIAATGNIIRQYNNDGMLFQGGAGLALVGNFNNTVTSNTVGPLGTNTVAAQGVGIRLNGGVITGDAYQICAQIGGAGLSNILTNSGITGSDSDYRVRQRFDTTVRLPGYGGGARDATAVVNFIDGNNTITAPAPGGTATVEPATGGGFIGGAACPQP